jgi:AraC-like DNA-binding protein/mannose-6-phosphate isomerase-like protein (cupin superfamily)
MTAQQELKENTFMPGKLFPVNVFHNYPASKRVMHLHWHEHLEILYVAKGDIIFDIGGYSYKASLGDLLFVHSGELHSGYSVSNEDVEYYAIVFSKSLFSGEAGDPLYGSMITPFFVGRKRLPDHLRPGEADYDPFHSSVLGIITEFAAKQAGYELAVRSHLQLLFAAALRALEGGRSSRKATSEIEFPYLQSFETLFTFIRNEYSRPISLSEAAQLVNMSVHHFCKTFKRITGCTFVEFVNLHRVNEAEQLLRTTDISVTEAADRVGFGSINYFIRIFKQFKHYSPSQCKRVLEKTL